MLSYMGLSGGDGEHWRAIFNPY